MQRILLVLLITIVFRNIANAQSFYDINTIQEIKIYFGFSNWDYRMDTAKAGLEGYTQADSVIVNGTKLLQCGVKYKGNSSYDAARTKNPIHIKLDYINNQNYQGYQDIKLGNGFTDNSIIREPLGYQILRQYMNAPLANFAKVYINGSYYGIMNNAEDINNEFLINNYYSNNKAFIKCNPVNAGPGSGNGSNLAYNGTDTANYNTKYELQSDFEDDWYELINLCDTLNNYYSSLNSILDIDRALWMLAFNNVLVNLDSYTGNFRQNYYLYRNHKNQWIPTVWDLNMCFGGFSSAGGTASNLTPATMQTMNYLLHKNENGWPLIYKLLNDPFYEKMYLAHCRTINNENFVNGNYKTNANSMHTLVDNAVQTDVNYLGTYANFQNSLTTNTSVSGGGQSVSPGLFPLMDGRATYLSNVLSATAPTIANVNATTTAIGAATTITADVTNQTNVFIGYRFDKGDRFVRDTMYDDGNHNDGAAGDGKYGASVVVQSTKMQYYIYAENANTGMFSPERAEHEFYEFSPSINAATSADLVINEITANNKSGEENEFGKYKDWIEIANKTGNYLSLNGYFLTDLRSNLTKWSFPSTAFIKPNEHLLIWADDNDTTYVDMHTNFNLDNIADVLFLTNGTSVIDSVIFGFQSVDMSYARCNDISGSFTSISNRTPRTINSCNVGINETKTINVVVYPNPANQLITIESDNAIAEIQLQSIDGKTIATAANTTQLNISNLNAGIYIITVKLSDNSIYTTKVIKL